MDKLKKSFSEAGFAAPRSLIGRAILVLFAFPAVATVVSYFLFFIYAVLRARERLSAYEVGELDLPKIRGYSNNADYLIHTGLGYICSVGNRFMMYFYAYLDRILAFALFCGIVWFFIRFRRNGAFSSREWFKVMFYGWILIILRGLTFCLWGFFDGDSGISGVILSVSYCIITSYLVYIFVRAAFLSQPSETFVSWNDGFSSREFFSKNLSACKKFLLSFRLKFIIAALFAFAVFDYIFWTLQCI